MLSIDVEHAEDTALLRCRGRIVQGSGLDLLQRTAMSRMQKHLVVDLTHVTSIDAGGLGVLVELQRWASESARALTLLNPSEFVRGLLAVTKLDTVLHVLTIQEHEETPELSREALRSTPQDKKKASAEAA